MNRLKKARHDMRKAFEEDEGFRQGYVANIAMAIKDDLTPAKVSNADKRHEFSNAMAEKILQLVFYSK